MNDIPMTAVEKIILDSVNDVRSDIRDVDKSIGKMRGEIGGVKANVENVSNRLTTHEKTKHGRRDSLPPRAGMTPRAWLYKLAPVLVAAGLGLLGLGFYIGTTGDGSAVRNLITENK